MRAIWLLVVVLVAGCQTAASTPIDARAPQDLDAAVFQECTTVCLRPGDCAVGFPDNGTCPAGFRCARTFQCGRD